MSFHGVVKKLSRVELASEIPYVLIFLLLLYSTRKPGGKGTKRNSLLDIHLFCYGLVGSEISKTFD